MKKRLEINANDPKTHLVVGEMVRLISFMLEKKYGMLDLTSITLASLACDLLSQRMADKIRDDVVIVYDEFADFN